jgi:hypothetical protein
MVAALEPQVEIDDRIRANPALLEAVTQAMAYLGRNVSGAPLPAAIRWRFLPLDQTTVELTLTDSTDAGDLTARRQFRVNDLIDDYSRESGMHRAWGDLLRLRSDKQMARINAFIKDLNRVIGEQIEGAP